MKTEVCCCSVCRTVANVVDQRGRGGQISGFAVLGNNSLTSKCLVRRLRPEDHHESVLPKKHYCERVACSKDTTGFFEEDISNLIYEHFRAAGAHEAALDLSELFDVY